ncbi:MAG TPA: PAS domain S-box protein [Thermoanaerobaculia bacterium]|nr:PAS domain S-box protein [Thermoanaerobaculia bacterium]HUM29105.1 PAS domain S-box protein [Thermoanaerobaculia bacterium]HXK67482.1 PAS domain S-box protein [Thermoanaerobaculia bacterium]
MVTHRRTIHVLLIDSSKEDYSTIQNLLSTIRRERFDLTWAQTLEKARDHLEQERPDIILLDLSRRQFIDENAFQSIQFFASKIPVIVIIDPDDETMAMEAVLGGAQGHLVLSHINSNLLVLAIVSAIERKWTEEALHHLLDLEKLMTLISTHFINVGQREIESAIARTLETIGKFSQVDRCYIYLFSENLQTLTLSHQWAMPDLPLRRAQGTPIVMEMIPETSKLFLSGNPLNIAAPGDILPEIKHELVVMGAEDARSTIAVPMKYGETVVGCVGLDSIRSPRRWGEEDFNLLTMVGEIFANTLGRMRVEQQLHLLTTALQVAAHGVVITDEKGLFQWVNQAFTKLTGYEPEEVIGQSARILKSGHHDDAFYADIWKTVTSGKTWLGEIVNRRKDGSLYTEEQTITPVKQAGYRITHFIAIKQDITERKIAEETLKKSEERYRSLFENAVLGIYQTTPDGKIIAANPALIKMLGFSSFEEMAFLGLDATGYSDAQTRKLFQEIMEKDGSLQGFETVWRRKDGSQLYIRESATAIKNREGRVLYYEGVVEDITETRRATMETARIASELAQLIDTANAPIFGIDASGRINEWNQAAATLTNISKSNALGKDLLRNFIPTHHRDKVQEVLRKSLEGRSTSNFELPILTRDGRHAVVLLNATPRRDCEGMIVGVIGVGQDITARKEVERMKDEFVSIVSHELRTPLTSIHGSLGLLAEGLAGDLPAEARELISIALNSSRRLVLLTNDILDIQQIESGSMVYNFRAVDLTALVVQSLSAIRDYGNQFTVSFDLVDQPGPIWIHADPDRISQVMTNLLSNAAKFSPPGDTVRVTITVKQESVRVSVSDHGSGIPKEFQDRIFEKFARVRMSRSRQRGGTGLGLNICKAIVERHGGTISFESEVNVGTTFFFELPREMNDAAAP